MISPAVFFSRRWRWPTVVVIVGMLFLARLGMWQLDRLEWRRALNAQTAAELAQPPLQANEVAPDANFVPNRQMVASGRYDFEQQFIIESQIFNGQPGRYLLTPLRLDGREEALLVNRGWVPENETNLAQFDTPTDRVTIQGYIQAGETLSNGRQTDISAERRLFRVDVTAMSERLPYPTLPIYLLLSPADNKAVDNTFPYEIVPDLTLSEGSHFSYALQWFSFALVLLVIYYFYVKRQEQPASSD